MNAAPAPSMMRELVRLAWPVVGLNVLAVLSLAVDTAMLARTPQASATLTGLGYAVQTIFLLMVAMIGLSVGSVALAARAHGAGDRQRVRKVFEQSVGLTLLLGLVTATLGNLLAGPFLSLLGAQGEDLRQGLAYLRPLLSLSVVNYLSLLFTSLLRSVGNTSLPFRVALASNLVNFGCNAVLIFGALGLPALGVLGAAIGTAISQGFSVLVVGTLLARGAAPALGPVPWPRRPDPALARELLGIGAPAALDMVVLNVGMLGIIGMVGRIDPLAVAAHGMGLRVQALAFVPGMSVAQAIAALTGQAMGARQPARMRRVLYDGILLNMGMLSLLGVLLAWQAPLIVGLFDLDPDSALGQLTRHWMVILGTTMAPVGFFLAFTGHFQGTGRTRVQLAINTLATLFGLLPASALLGFGLGLGVDGVWAGLPLSFVIKAALALWVYRRSALPSLPLPE